MRDQLLKEIIICGTRLAVIKRTVSETDIMFRIVSMPIKGYVQAKYGGWLSGEKHVRRNLGELQEYAAERIDFIRYDNRCPNAPQKACSCEDTIEQTNFPVRDYDTVMRYFNERARRLIEIYTFASEDRECTNRWREANGDCKVGEGYKHDFREMLENERKGIIWPNGSNKGENQ